MEELLGIACPPQFKPIALYGGPVRQIGHDPPPTHLPSHPPPIETQGLPMGITNDYPQLVPPRGPVHGPQKPHFPENPRTKPTMAAECPGPSFGAQKTEKKGQKGHHFQAHGGYPFLALLISHNSKAPISAPQVGHQRGTQKPTAANPKPKRGLTHYGFMLGFFGLSCF